MPESSRPAARLNSSLLGTIDLVLRGIIVAVFAGGALVAATHWAVRSKRLNAFGAWPRLVRRSSDPLLRPLERRVVRMGGNPQDAPYWLLAVIVVAGLVTIGMFRWLAGLVLTLAAVGPAGPRAWTATALRFAFSGLKLALLVRVVASWLGQSYAGWMRPVLALTNWIIEPLRRVVPPLGPIDITPIVAYLILIVLEGAIFSLFFR
jgi:YggT family protein